jgi:hypothetical protein
MPGEIFVLILVALGCSTAVILGVARMWIGHARFKIESRTGGAREGSMTSGELRRLIQEAVEEATKPLVRQIEHLEAGLEAPKALPEGRRPALLEGAASGDEREAADAVASRHRTRA